MVYDLWTTPELKAKWDEFIIYRKEEKGLKPFKKPGEKRQFKYLLNICKGNEETAVKILDYAMNKQHEGFHEYEHILNPKNGTQSVSSRSQTGQQQLIDSVRQRLGDFNTDTERGIEPAY